MKSVLALVALAVIGLSSVALAEDALDLPPPVHTRRNIDAGHEAVDELREAFHGGLHFGRKCVILVLVADEHPKHVVIDAHCSALFVGRSQSRSPDAVARRLT